MKHKITSIVMPVCLGVIIVGLTGCTTTEDRYGRSTGRYIDDKEIASQVNEKLEHDPLYKFGQVHVAAYRGTVQLSGFALNDAQKERAGELASRVPGAIAVENNISIAPENPYSREFHARDTDQSGTNDVRQPVRDRENPENRPNTAR